MNPNDFNNSTGYNPNKKIQNVVAPTQLDNSGNVVGPQVVRTEVVVSKKPKKVKVKKPRKETDKETLVFIIVMLIILCVLVVFVCFFLLPDYLEEKESETFSTTTTTAPGRIEYYPIAELTINNGNNVTSYNSFNIEDNFDLSFTNDDTKNYITVNGKYIADADILYPKVSTMDDLLIFQVGFEEERSMKLFIVDNAGNIVLEVYNISKVPGLALLSVNYTSTTILVTLSRVSENKLFISNEYRNPSAIDVCDTERLDSNKIKQSSIVIGTYSIAYKGNHKFDSSKLVDSITLNDYLKNANNTCE